MIQEILILVNDTLKAMDEIESHIFINHRSKYAYAKAIFDNYREEIEEIRQELNGELDGQSTDEIKKEITNISQSVLGAKEKGIINPIGNIETLDSTIDAMIKDLDSNALETVLPTANIDIQTIENAIPTSTIENATPSFENAIAQPTVEVLADTQDIIPTVQPIVIEEGSVSEVVAPVTQAPQIVDGAQAEVVQTVTPDIVITSDQSSQMSTIAPTIEVPNVEPMVQVPNIEVPNATPFIDTTQETEA